ncbi:MAG: Hsp33 family molecular chaperone HslO [Verrucomicrobia bacterium]|nr:Hsp33 family molecular chaperone HslO [Verrucomicrobiota bacterium]
MLESTPINPAHSGLEVTTWFVRHRNVLFAQADFLSLYVDYYLHLSDQALKVSPEHDALFKRALAGFVLHAASRPWNELTAWTINFQEPLVNLFLTGDNADGSVTGRVFSEDVKELPNNLFFADVVRGTQPKRRSSVEFPGADPLAAVEAYYRQSEQRPARYFQTGEEEFALVTAHPDYDEAWFDALTVDQVRTLAKDEELGVLEKRIYRWHCGCNQQRMLQVLAPIFRQDAEGLFGTEEKLEIRCPRCAARHAITREAMEAFVAKG